MTDDENYIERRSMAITLPDKRVLLSQKVVSTC